METLKEAIANLTLAAFCGAVVGVLVLLFLLYVGLHIGSY